MWNDIHLVVQPWVRSAPSARPCARTWEAAGNKPGSCLGFPGLLQQVATRVAVYCLGPRGQHSEVKALAGLNSLWSLWGTTLPCHSQLLAAPGGSWWLLASLDLSQHRSAMCLHLHVAFVPCPCVPHLSLFSDVAPFIGFRVHAKSRTISSHTLCFMSTENISRQGPVTATGVRTGIYLWCGHNAKLYQPAFQWGRMKDKYLYCMVGGSKCYGKGGEGGMGETIRGGGHRSSKWVA